MSAYSYKKLNAAKHEFRLLILEPARKGKWEDKLRCSLTTTVLNHPNTPRITTYEAVSYCWGESTPYSSILVDGCLLSITENLDSFLRRKRVRSSKQRLWIDAICINQADNAERTQQVELMSKIYQCAERLVIWLGEEADDSQMAMQDLAAFGTGRTKLLTSNVGYNAMDNLIKRAYWDRMWVVQELVIGAAGQKANEAQVICGKERVAWSCLVRGLEFIESQQKIGRQNFYGLRKILDLEEARKAGGGGSLLSWLVKTRNKLSSEDRDKVYGLLGIADLSIGNLGHFRPDYEKPTSRVFHEIAASNIISSQTLEVLRHCRTRSLSDLPSWVADWSVDDKVALLPAYTNNGIWNGIWKDDEDDSQNEDVDDEDEGNLAPSSLEREQQSHLNLGNTSSSTNIQARDFWPDTPPLIISEDTRILTAPGFIWDTIKTLSEPFPSDVSEHWENATHFMINVGRCKALLDALPDHPNPYQNIRGRLKSFWRALCADHSGEGDYQKPSYLFQSDEEDRRVDFENWLPPIPNDWVPRPPHVSSIWTTTQYRKAVHAYLHLDEFIDDECFDVAEWEAKFPAEFQGRRDLLGEFFLQVSSGRHHGAGMGHIMTIVVESLMIGHELAELWQEGQYDLIISPFQLPCVIPDPFLHLRGNVFPLDVTIPKEMGIVDFTPGSTMDERSALFPGDFRAERYALGRRFFVSEKGYLGLCPAESRVGDRIAVMVDGNIPFVLRDEEEGYSAVGEAHVQGVMNGEALKECKATGCVPELIEIV
ncbi:hypothetical protein MMC18_003631 [Xylographa bjoerkii]|nr:hypothetical protein [Xylographa bjoerkii]